MERSPREQVYIAEYIKVKWRAELVATRELEIESCPLTGNVFPSYEQINCFYSWKENRIKECQPPSCLGEEVTAQSQSLARDGLSKAFNESVGQTRPQLRIVSHGGYSRLAWSPLYFLQINGSQSRGPLHDPWVQYQEFWFGRSLGRLRH